MNVTGGSSEQRAAYANTAIASGPSESVTSRLSEAAKALNECHALAEQMAQHLGVLPTPPKDGAGGPGLAGLTMSLRSEIMSLRSRLQEIAGAL